MGQIKVEKNVSGIEGLCIIEPAVHGDARGWFMETYNRNDMLEEGIDIVFIQDNQSYSKSKGIIRGIHFQNNPKPQTKLVRCVRGRIMDFAVDLRADSPTFKKWFSIELSAENKKQVLLPSGFGHGFITLEDDCEVQYKVDEWYYPEYDRSIIWNDPDIGIDWGTDSPIISDKDAKAPTLRDSDVNFAMNIN